MAASTMSRDGPAQVTVRPAVPLAARLADPVPLGLAGFGLTTFVLSLIMSGLISITATPAVFGLALAYGGLVQLAAGMWAFVRNNTFAAVALASYGGFWIAFWAFNAFFLDQIPKGEQPDAQALFLIPWAVFSFYMWIVSFRVNLGVMLVLLFLWPAYLLIGLGFSGRAPTVTHIGGAFGIATAVMAWYVSFADTLHNTVGRKVLPLVPFSGKQVDEPPEDVKAYRAASRERQPTG